MHILCQNILVLLFLVPRLCLRRGNKILHSGPRRASPETGHMATSPTPCPSRACPPFYFSYCYQNVKKASYPYCQGNYLLFPTERGVTYNFHDDSRCSLKRKETQWLVCHSLRRWHRQWAGFLLLFLLHSIFIQEILPRPPGCSMLDDMTFLYPNPSPNISPGLRKTPRQAQADTEDRP